MSDSISVNESSSFQMYLIYVGRNVITFFYSDIYEAK